MGVHEGNWCLASFFYIDERSVGSTLTTEMYLWEFDIFHQFCIFPWQLWHYHFPFGWNSHYLVTKSNPWLNIDNRQSTRKIPWKRPFCLSHWISFFYPRWNPSIFRPLFNPVTYSSLYISWTDKTSFFQNIWCASFRYS